MFSEDESKAFESQLNIMQGNNIYEARYKENGEERSIYFLKDFNRLELTIFVPYDVRILNLRVVPILSDVLDTLWNSVKIIGGGPNLVEIHNILKSISAKELELNDVNVENVLIASSVYKFGVQLEKLDVSWTQQCKNLEDISEMFMDVKVDKIDISKLNSKHVKYMNSLFRECKSDLIGTMNTSKLEHANGMFHNYGNINYSSDKYKPKRTLDLRWMNTNKLVYAGDMFYGCTYDEIILLGWNTEQVRDTSQMFRDVKANIIGLNDMSLNNVACSSAMFKDSMIFNTTVELNSNFEYIERCDYMFNGTTAVFVDMRHATKLSKTAVIDKMFTFYEIKQLILRKEQERFRNQAMNYWDVAEALVLS